MTTRYKLPFLLLIITCTAKAQQQQWANCDNASLQLIKGTQIFDNWSYSSIQIGGGVLVGSSFSIKQGE